MAPPCKFSANARCDLRLRQAKPSAASATKATPMKRNSMGTLNQP